MENGLCTVPRTTTQVTPNTRADCSRVVSSAAEGATSVKSTGLLFHPETGLLSPLPLCPESWVTWGLSPFVRPLFCPLMDGARVACPAESPKRLLSTCGVQEDCAMVETPPSPSDAASIKREWRTGVMFYKKKKKKGYVRWMCSQM